LNRKKTRADAIKCAFSRNEAFNYVRGDIFGPEFCGFFFSLFYNGKSSELHRIAGSLRATPPEQYKNNRNR
jgi:hypothetical protein